MKVAGIGCGSSRCSSPPLVFVTLVETLCYVLTGVECPPQQSMALFCGNGGSSNVLILVTSSIQATFINGENSLAEGTNSVEARNNLSMVRKYKSCIHHTHAV